MSTIAVRDFSEADRTAVEALYELTFGSAALRAWQERHRWQFFDHPACKSHPSKLWVATRSEKVVAFLAAFPMQLKVGDSERTIFLPCDLMVAKEARFGPNLGTRLMNGCVAASGGIGLSLAHSREAAKLFEKLGFEARTLGPIYMRPHHGAPLASRFLTEQRMPARLKKLPLPLLQKLASPLLTVAVRSLHLLHRPRRARGVEVREVAQFGAEFDDLWRTLSPAYPIVGVRDRAFLDWRLKRDPSTKHTVFEARTAAGLRGYIAVCFAHARGVRFGRIMDLFCDPGEHAVIDALLRAGIDQLEAGDADVIATRGLHPAIRAPVKRFLYLSPPSAQFTARLLCQDPTLAPFMYDEANWHTCHADGDEDFVT